MTTYDNDGEDLIKRAADRIGEIAYSDDMEESPATWLARLISLAAVQSHIEQQLDPIADKQEFIQVCEQAAKRILEDPPIPGLTAKRVGMLLHAALAVSMAYADAIERSMPTDERPMPSEDPPMGPRPAVSHDDAVADALIRRYAKDEDDTVD